MIEITVKSNVISTNPRNKMQLQAVNNSTQTKEQMYLENQITVLTSLVIGAKDENGNIVSKIYARGDEYVIYEVANLSSIESLKVKIHTKLDDDLAPILNFQLAKDGFDKLKSVMYKTGADPSYKQRAAAAIALAILGKINEAKEQFNRIEKDAEEDYEHRIYGRLFYLLGAVVITLILSGLTFVSYIYRDSSFLMTNTHISKLLNIMTFAALGGFLSVSFKAKEVIGQRAINYWMYSIFGAERLIISIVAGIAIFLLIKSGILFTPFVEGANGFYFLMSVCFLSGFSETLIPSYMGKLEKSV
jgi:hypothetical protein